MATVTLGKTNITVNKNGFGALPIQRISLDESVYLLHKALDNGITFYDTARGYSDSEEKLAAAFSQKRDQVIIATKTHARTGENFLKDLETSLRTLKTEYLDIYQFHNPRFCPKPGDGTGLYEAMLQAKQEGKVRFIGITNHRLDIASEAVESGLYDTLQYPLSYISLQRDIDLVKLTQWHNMGFIGMKALSGGLIKNSRVAYLFMTQFQNVVPIWGIQRESELDEFLSYDKTPPEFDAAYETALREDAQALSGDFCRGCGYCMPCPAQIEINSCARMSLFLRRSPTQRWLSDENQAMMRRIEDCIECGACKAKCPYGLDTPNLLKENYKDYIEVLGGKEI